VNNEYCFEVSEQVTALGRGIERELKSSYSVEVCYEAPSKYRCIFKSGFIEFLSSCPGVGELANMLPTCTQRLCEFLIIDDPDNGLTLEKDTLYSDAFALLLEELAKYSGESVKALFELIEVQVLRCLNTILMRDVDELAMQCGEHRLFESNNRETRLRISHDSAVKVAEISDVKRIIGDECKDDYDMLRNERWQALVNTKTYLNTILNYTKYQLGEGGHLDLYEYVYQSRFAQQDKQLKRTIKRRVRA